MKERYRLIGDMLSSRRFTKLARNLTHRTTDQSLHFLFSLIYLNGQLSTVWFTAIYRITVFFLGGVLDRFQNMPCRCGKTFLITFQTEQSQCKKGSKAVKHCRQPTKLHLPTQASSYVINLWLRWQTPVTTPLSCLVSTAY